MGVCSNCKEKIRYNKYKRYRGKILCYKCYSTRLERKKAKKEAAEKIVEPTEKIREEPVDLDAYEDIKVTQEEQDESGN